MRSTNQRRYQVTEAAIKKKALKKYTRVEKIASRLKTILAGMEAKNEIKLAKTKPDREAEQYHYGYSAAIAEIQEVLDDLIPFDG